MIINYVTDNIFCFLTFIIRLRTENTSNCISVEIIIILIDRLNFSNIDRHCLSSLRNRLLNEVLYTEIILFLVTYPNLVVSKQIKDLSYITALIDCRITWLELKTN